MKKYIKYIVLLILLFSSPVLSLATQDVMPYSTFMSTYRYPAVIGTITVAVANQATHSANYTIELIISR